MLASWRRSSGLVWCCQRSPGPGCGKPQRAYSELEIVAIARHRGVLSKVAVRRRPGVKLSRCPVTMVVGLGADYVNGVSGQRVHLLQCQGDPVHYIAESPWSWLRACHRTAALQAHGELLGEVDVRGARGGRGINLLRHTRVATGLAVVVYDVNALLPIGTCGVCIATRRTRTRVEADCNHVADS